MNYNPTPDLIRKKISDLGYNSVNARFVLAKDSFWKVIMCRFIFDLNQPKNDEILLKKDNFTIEDFSLSLEKFYEFLDYLKQIHGQQIQVTNSKQNIPPHLLFKIGNYELCLIGDYPSRELEFYGRQIMSRNHGIQKPSFFTHYYINSSVQGRLPRDLDLADYEVPLRDGVEAINYFWKTNYEHHHLNSVSCEFFMPLYDANIRKVTLNNTLFKIKFEINSNTKKDDLSLSLVAMAPGHSHREKYKISNETMEVDIRFTPNDATLYLNKKGKRIDVYNYYPPRDTRSYLGEPEITSMQDLEVPLEVAPKNLKPFLEIEHFQDPFYTKLIEQINKCYLDEMPDLALERIRKLFENLIIDVLKKKYQSDVSTYQNAKKRHHPFHIVVTNTKEKIRNGDFDNVRNEFEEAINWISKLRDKGSKSTHSITFDVKTEYLDEINNEIERKVALLRRILTII